MVNILQIKRRAASLNNPGPPLILNDGEMAVNFAGDQTGDDKPSLYVGDVDGMVHLLVSGSSSDKLNITAKYIPGEGDDPSADGNAQSPADGEWPWVVAEGELPIVTWNGQTFIFTGGAGTWGTFSGGDALGPDMFVPLGAGVTFASVQEIADGTKSFIAIDPVGFQGYMDTLKIEVPTANPPDDEGRLPVLNANGKLDPRFIEGEGLNWLDPLDLTEPDPGVQNENGNIIEHNGGVGLIDDSWGIENNPEIQTGDMILSDGEKWHLIMGGLSSGNYVKITGAKMKSTALLDWSDEDAALGTVIIDGGTSKSSTIKSVTLNETAMDIGEY